MDKLFFDSWESLLRTGIIALLSYLGLLSMLRIVGNRTLTQLNAFDLVVTVALGSTLATAILTKSVPLFDGLLGFAMLIGLQWVIGKFSFQSQIFRNLIKTEPKLLYFKGEYLKKALEECHVTEDEILQVIRATGIAKLEDADAVVLETNGKFSVVKKSESSGRSSLENVKDFKAHSHKE